MFSLKLNYWQLLTDQEKTDGIIIINRWLIYRFAHAFDF